MKTTRILAVDDHPGYRMGLVGIVNSTADLTVVGEAGSCAEAIEANRRLNPDLILMDLRLPDGSAVECILAIKRESPQCLVIIVTTYDADEDIYRALQAGARSYLLKEAAAEDIRATIRAVIRGETPLAANVAQRLASRMSRPNLTRREHDMLRMIIRGRSNKEIGVELGITEDTVKGHLKNLFVKLGVKDRTQAAVTALEQGIIHLGERRGP